MLTNEWKWPDTILTVVILILAAALLYRRTKASKDNVQEESWGIQETIQRVSRELAAADSTTAASGRPALFEVRSFDLELNFIVKSNTSGNVGGEFQVVTVGGKYDYGEEKVQKIRLHMVTAPRADSVQVDTTLS